MTAQVATHRKRKALAALLLLIGAILAFPFLLAMMLSGAKERR
ncbi:hypothetical protein [Sphingomonas sp. IC-56]|nr:hypothetical protein [Sphingomonas sp. IC-56]